MVRLAGSPGSPGSTESLSVTELSKFSYMDKNMQTNYKSVGATTQIINEGKNCVLKYKPVYHPALFAAYGLHLWSHLHPSLKGHSRPNMNLPQFIEPCMLISAVLTVFSYVL